MKLDVIGQRIMKCTYENSMGPNMKMNLPVSVNNQIKLPKDFSKESFGTVISKVMVGSPMQPLYIYLEQVTNFMDTEPVEGEAYDNESMMSLFKTICIPVAMREVEKNLQNLCRVYHIPEIKLERNK